MAKIIVDMKGIVCEFKFDNRIFYIKNLLIGDMWIKIGEPSVELKRDIIKNPRSYNQIIVDTVKAWSNEDLEKIGLMETDYEMILDMKKDFEEDGYDILEIEK